MYVPLRFFSSTAPIPMLGTLPGELRCTARRGGGPQDAATCSSTLEPTSRQALAIYDFARGACRPRRVKKQTQSLYCQMCLSVCVRVCSCVFVCVCVFFVFHTLSCCQRTWQRRAISMKYVQTSVGLALLVLFQSAGWGSGHLFVCLFTLQLLHAK